MISAQQVRRPLVGIALSVAFGLFLQHRIGGSPLLILGLTALLLAWICRNPSSRQTTPAIYVICGLLAAAGGAIETRPTLSRSALAVAEVILREQALVGRVSDDPAVSDADGTVSFLLDTETLRYGRDTLPSDAVLRVYLRGSNAPVQFGETWKLRGVYTGYERPRSGADGFLSVQPDGATRLQPAEASLAHYCYGARQRTAKSLSAGIEAFPEHANLLCALLLGYRQAISAELYQLFSRTGTLHIFAISGQHVVILAAILIAGLKIAGISRPRWGLLLIPGLFLYIFTTGMQPSALRALTMAAVYFAAPLIGRRPDAPSSMALSAIILLSICPANISDPGFLLSFVVVCGLIMVHGWASREIHGFRRAGWDAPLKRLGGPHPAAALLRSIGMLMLTSLAAWLFSAPITAQFFYTVSPAALVGNLAVIPLTFMIMLAGCLALLAGGLFFPAAALFNQANLLFISLLMWIVRHLEALPGSCRAVRAPSVWVTGLWFAGLTLFFTGPVRWRKGALLVFMLACIFWGTAQIVPRRGLEILRSGSSAVAVHLPEKDQWILVTDGNPFTTVRTIRLLQKEGVDRLDTLVLSGSRADPGAVKRLQEIFRPRQTRILNEEGGSGWSVGGGVIRISPDRW